MGELDQVLDDAVNALDSSPKMKTHFTVVFEGDIRKVKNLFGRSKYGRPVASGYGHAFEAMDRCRDILETIEP